jgi:hypothetical protein
MIGTALGGPFGGLAGTLLGKVLGVDATNPTEDQLAQAVQGMTPADYAKIKQAELDFKAHMAELGIQEAQLTYQDRDSARKREMEVKDWTPRLLALGLTVGFFTLLAFLVFHEAPPGSRDLLNIMLGALGGGWTTMLAYYFGGSQGGDSAVSKLSALTGGK